MNWKLATFNVNGIRARLPIVIDWLRREQPEVLCLQEIKCQDQDFPGAAFVDLGYTVTVRGQKAFNGVAILGRQPPDEVVRSFDDRRGGVEARLLAVRIGDLWVVNSYVPQGRAPDDPAFQYKLGFLAGLKDWFAARFDIGAKLIWTGDINVAPGPIDVHDPERLDGQVGFHPEERQAFRDVLAWGLTDLFRARHPDSRRFTFWDYRLPNALKRNLGWRIDHILVTAPLLARAAACDIDPAPRALPRPSDHTPVWARFEL